MYLTAALLPPSQVVRDLHDFAGRSATALPPVSRAVAARGGAPVLALASRQPWQVVPTARMAAHLARFGYVAPREVDAMRELVAGLIAPHDTFTVSLGGSVHVDHTRRQVLLEVQGETDRLEEVVDALTASVHRSGFAQDRRRFKPMVPVLSFQPGLRLGALVRTVEALETRTPTSWTVRSIGLVHRELSRRDAQPTEMDHLPLSA